MKTKKGENMKIIDFEKKGNSVRFALSNRDENYWGDDWNDAPYEDNAGPVYGHFVEEYADFGFGFSAIVLEPSQAYRNSYTKEDMKERKVPCLIVASRRSLTYSGIPEWEWDDFTSCLESDILNIIKIYFGDDIEKIERQFKALMTQERLQNLAEGENALGDCFIYQKFCQFKKHIKDGD